MEDKINNLTIKEQFGLYFILKEVCNEEEKAFYTSDFLGVIENYNVEIKTKEGVEKNILSELNEKGILKQIPSIGEKMWQIPDKIYSNSDYYIKNLKDIPKVKAFWVD